MTSETTAETIATLSQETNQSVRNAAEERRATKVLIQETNDITKATYDTAKAMQLTPPSKASYASVLTSNAAPLSKPITISTRPRHSFKHNKYGHIGTQCKANIAYGYCAEAHNSKDCPTKIDKSATRKCAVCKGAHEAWNNRCPVRKTELNKVKAVYNARQPYHFVPSAKEKPSSERVTFSVTPAESAVMMNGSQRGRLNTTSTGLLSSTPSLLPSRQSSRSRSPVKGRAPKRVYTGVRVDSTQDEGEDTIMVESSQRPRRPHMPSRRALESNTANSLHSSQWNIEES
ncbi:hypothetical protein GLAREA_10450 [Glarea lozoyensis ATCC 20868]|uniref:Uncharacterized protein n=1 Tax=Glarea lozoyensis (strain ATCC 20868 / MF5171) TaxID=1116229 RepID=S3DS25_GLAL2|nr:uncharacterized protein GLAREA_10450 [Glarea lozoyensis ATCC 20868]EPE34756.1 hypothetical protein GLAREA_10450 [Glarea lozoyensis ATCC 20868]